MRDDGAITIKTKMRCCNSVANIAVSLHVDAQRLEQSARCNHFAVEFLQGRRIEHRALRVAHCNRIDERHVDWEMRIEPHDEWLMLTNEHLDLGALCTCFGTIGHDQHVTRSAPVVDVLPAREMQWLTLYGFGESAHVETRGPTFIETAECRGDFRW